MYKKIMLFLLIAFQMFSQGKIDFNASKTAPGGLLPKETPMFILIGSDDNYNPSAMNWVVEMMRNKKNSDGTLVRATYFNAGFGVTDKTAKVFKKAISYGNEMGNHTQNHKDTTKISYDELYNEIKECTEIQYKYGVYGIKGFRSPYLSYNKNTFEILKKRGFLYDSSIEEGFQLDQTPENNYWPYTLSNGSPGNEFWQKRKVKTDIGKINELWELPVYALELPSDEMAIKYGMLKGIRDRAVYKDKNVKGYNYKISGLDLWLNSYGYNSKEMTGILKYNLDLRLKGNRAPMIYVIHSNHYNNPKYREYLEEFIDYALTKKEVRFITYSELIDWMKNPKKL